MIKIENITVNFGGVKALSGVSLTFPDNIKVGIIGTNGAGKTTLLNVITGNIIPQSGKVYYNSTDITGWEPDDIANLGLVRTFQNSLLYKDLTVEENILLGLLKKYPLNTKLNRIKRENRELILQHFQTLNIGKRYLSKYPAELPYGIRRMIEIIRLIILQPGIIFFDEPTTGLTKQEVTKLSEYLLQLSSQNNIDYVFGIEHNLNFLFNIVDKIVLMDKGKIIFSGKKEELFSEYPEYKNYI